MGLRVRLRAHEVGLWFRHGGLHRVLGPGAYWMPSALLGGFVKGRDQISVFDTLKTELVHPLLPVLVTDPRLRERLEVVDLSDDERALIWYDGRLAFIRGRGLHAFWRAPRTVTVERFSVNEGRFRHPKLDAVTDFSGGTRYFDAIRVASHERALLFRDGELIEQLGPGLHVYWKGNGTLSHRTVDMRERVADVAGQEIMSADKVTLRVNLVVTFQVVDPLLAVTSVADSDQALYREAQLALREAVGTRTLDRLLGDKDEVGKEVRNAIAERTSGFGVSVKTVRLRDIILTGEMKSLLNEVILAQKQSEANLIRRREETAAARSQANTAKLLESSPVLTRMKELEALREILAGSKATFVLGGGDIVEQVRGLVGEQGGV